MIILKEFLGLSINNTENCTYSTESNLVKINASPNKKASFIAFKFSDEVRTFIAQHQSNITSMFFSAGIQNSVGTIKCKLLSSAQETITFSESGKTSEISILKSTTFAAGQGSDLQELSISETNALMLNAVDDNEHLFICNDSKESYDVNNDVMRLQIYYDDGSVDSDIPAPWDDWTERKPIDDSTAIPVPALRVHKLGTYKVLYKVVSADGTQTKVEEAVAGTFSIIAKIAEYIQAPQARDLTYKIDEQDPQKRAIQQELCSAVQYDELIYKARYIATNMSESMPTDTDSRWSPDIPKRADAGSYKVWYRLEVNDTYADRFTAKTFEAIICTIKKAATTVQVKAHIISGQPSFDINDMSVNTTYLLDVVGDYSDFTVQENDNDAALLQLDVQQSQIKLITRSRIGTFSFKVKTTPKNDNYVPAECVFTFKISTFSKIKLFGIDGNVYDLYPYVYDGTKWVSATAALYDGTAWAELNSTRPL